jgi:Predicted membrane protein (DUF2306)
MHTSLYPAPGQSRPKPMANPGSAGAQVALRWAARGWFGVALVGQLVFLAYVVGFYGGAALAGDFARWNKVMPRGLVDGDSTGNAVLMAHLFFTAVILMGGLLQLLPALRRAAPRVHHWVGRLYIGSAVVLALGGLFMVWTRGEAVQFGQHLGISLNALLILLFAGLALRAAIARRIDAHRRWALRLWFAVLGVWFFRLGLTLWLLIHQAPVGFDMKSFSGPFLTFLSFAQTLIPLALLQLYFVAQRSKQPMLQGGVAALLAGLTLATAAGIGTASMMLWLPRL